MFVAYVQQIPQNTTKKGAECCSYTYIPEDNLCLCSRSETVWAERENNNMIPMNTDFWHMLDVFNEPLVFYIPVSQNTWNCILRDILLVRTQQDAFANNRWCYNWLVEFLNVKLRKTVQQINSLFLPLFIRTLLTRVDTSQGYNIYWLTFIPILSSKMQYKQGF